MRVTSKVVTKRYVEFKCVRERQRLECIWTVVSPPLLRACVCSGEVLALREGRGRVCYESVCVCPSVCVGGEGG